MKKLVLYAVSGVLWTACLGLVAVVWLEYLGGYDFIDGIKNEREGRFRLYQTAYYGQPLADDPYRAFSVQHLNPFYMFSLPWAPEDITAVNNAAANNAVVTLNARGFRESASNGAARKGVILGGSTAFGSQASGDGTTLSSALNSLQAEYDFLNYGVPSWNSHQEMVAYSKIPFGTDFVIAFTGANDFIVALRYCKQGYAFPVGSPESFEYLAAITDDIRGERKLGGLFFSMFPQTQKKVSKLLAKVSGSARDARDCRARILEAAEAFIANQRVIGDLARARGARYLLALQPHLTFLVAPGDEDERQEAELRAAFYAHVAESDFCRAADCVDLSRLFAGFEPLHVGERPDSPNAAIFADKVHLTDRGYAFAAEALKDAIRP